MHKKIIWGALFCAFIFDFLRSKANLNPKNIFNKSESFYQYKNNSFNSKKNKVNNMKAKIDGEELNVKTEFNNNYDNEDFQSNINSNNDQDIYLRIQFCQSWSYNNYFNQVKKQLESTFSNVYITPENYPLPPIKKFLSLALSISQKLIIAYIVAGDYINPYIQNYIPSQYLDLIKNNKLKTGIFAFFGINLINGMLTSTKAFEIYLNDNLIWSALQNNGNVLKIEHLVQILQKYGAKTFY